MGNVVVFRRRADAFPPNAARGGCSTSSGSKEAAAEALSAPQHSQIPFNSFHTTRCARDLTKPNQNPDHDAYLLVLLADHEMIAGRDAEARYLLDAAYTAFDRKIDGAPGYEALG